MTTLLVILALVVPLAVWAVRRFDAARERRALWIAWWEQILKAE